MRVLYFSRDYTPHDYRFLTSLAESGQEVYFLRLERSGRQVEDRPLPASVQQVALEGGQGPVPLARPLPACCWPCAGYSAGTGRICCTPGRIQTAAFLAALSGFRPLVSMSWGSDLLKDADRSRAYRWITRYTFAQSTVLVGDCQAVKEKASHFGFPPER